MTYCSHDDHILSLPDVNVGGQERITERGLCMCGLKIKVKCLNPGLFSPLTFHCVSHTLACYAAVKLDILLRVKWGYDMIVLQLMKGLHVLYQLHNKNTGHLSCK